MSCSSAVALLTQIDLLCEQVIAQEGLKNSVYITETFPCHTTTCNTTFFPLIQAFSRVGRTIQMSGGKPVQGTGGDAGCPDWDSVCWGKESEPCIKLGRASALTSTTPRTPSQATDFSGSLGHHFFPLLSPHKSLRPLPPPPSIPTRLLPAAPPPPLHSVGASNWGPADPKLPTSHRVSQRELHLLRGYHLHLVQLELSGGSVPVRRMR